MNTEGDIQDNCYLLLGWTKLCDVGVVAVPLWPGHWLNLNFWMLLVKEFLLLLLHFPPIFPFKNRKMCIGSTPLAWAVVISIFRM